MNGIEFFNVKYLCVYINEDYLAYESFRVGGEDLEGSDELFEKYPSIRKDGKFFLKIDIKTGEVINWPKGVNGDFYTFKVTDSGDYALETENSEEVAKYGGYVPPCFGDKYGDYFEFEIGEDGKIKDWSFTEKDFNIFMEEVRKYEEY
jgi:hypothetical protein